ncbi:NUDIX hydrolase domain-like protein [Lasiosphaeris hirsuta]|uniref:NUDIX hydrolase domain-like protein n=1 Tax=Lasiosphaeris hirsuta TaxID=260670 RepID=A0AA40AY60_9PEZI|nr:NUDIX hydrolase domain-like protein [Lasiosphaeris hirsuta]
MAESHASSQAETNPAPPKPTFTIDPSLAEWAVPSAVWLSTNQARLTALGHKLSGLASGVVVFDAAGRVLVMQRASTDSMPDRWEVPGGGVDATDASVVAGAARELWEEAGLVATRFRGLVTEGPGGRELQVFPNRNRTRWYCRFAFVADVESCDAVALDPNEHQAYAWATEGEIREERVGGRETPITVPEMKLLILEAFRLRKEAGLV